MKRNKIKKLCWFRLFFLQQHSVFTCVMWCLLSSEMQEATAASPSPL